jgi:Flp pilus assembly protein protease CpaA
MNWLIIHPTFVIGLIALGYFTYIDYKHSEIENEPIWIFLLISLVVAYISPSTWVTIALMALMLSICYLLWRMGSLGGADVKILPGIIPFLGLTGFVQSISGFWVFLVLFGIIGTLYGLIGKFVLKQKEIPFLGAITTTFLVFWYYKSTWV